MVGSSTAAMSWMVRTPRRSISSTTRSLCTTCPRIAPRPPFAANRFTFRSAIRTPEQNPYFAALLTFIGTRNATPAANILGAGGYRGVLSAGCWGGRSGRRGLGGLSTQGTEFHDVHSALSTQHSAPVLTHPSIQHSPGRARQPSAALACHPERVVEWGAKDPLPKHDTRSVGRGSFAPTRHPLLRK